MQTNIAKYQFCDNMLVLPWTTDGLTYISDLKGPFPRKLGSKIEKLEANSSILRYQNHRRRDEQNGAGYIGPLAQGWAKNGNGIMFR